MIIGFLGKGGSGKTTLSTAMVHFLSSKNNTVLAIDADHNMDLTYNLGIEHTIPYLGDAMPDLKKILSINGHYRDFFASFTSIEDVADENIAETSRNLQDFRSSFRITREHEDIFTKGFSTVIDQNLSLMSAGPHTDKILNGNNCSHSLSTPLRIYLPLMELEEREFVIVDEKAGRDGASTGTPTGFDIAFISAEPTVYGMKAASQIAEILDFFETPYEFIINKAEDSHLDESWSGWKLFLNKKPILKIPKLCQISSNFQEYFSHMEQLLGYALKELENTPLEHQRYSRSIRKFKKQKESIGD